MPEPVLRLPGHRGGALLLDEVALGEPAQRALHHVDRAVHGRGDRAGPEVHPDDGGDLKHRAVGGVEQVHPVGDDRVDAVRHGQRIGGVQPPAGPRRAQRALFDEHPGVLVGVERVAVGQFDQGGQRVRRERGEAQQVRVHGGDLGVAQRRQRDGQRAGDRAGPGRVPLDQFRPRGAEQQQRNVAGGGAEQFQEPQHGLVRPVQVLEHENGGLPPGQRHHEPPPRRLGLLGREVGPGEAHQRAERVGQPYRLLGAHQLAERRVQAFPRGVRRVGVEDAGLGLHDVGQRGVGHVLAERRAAPDPPGDRLVQQPPGVLVQLADEAALADAGVPENGDELRRTVAQRPVQRVDQQAQLVGTVHQRAGVHVPVRVGALQRGDRQPHLRGAGPPAQGHGRLFLVADRGTGRRVRRAAHEYSAGRRHRLQPGGGVHHVAGDDRLPPVARGGEVDQRLTGGHAHAEPEARRGRRRSGRRVPGQQPLQFEPGPHAAHGVGLGRHGRPEQRHHRVADVLLDHAAVLADDAPGGGEVLVLDAAYLFRVGPLGVRGEPDHV